MERDSQVSKIAMGHREMIPAIFAKNNFPKCLLRWVKFEEEVEEGGSRWSKPHVATLSLHSLFELRSMLLNGTICLDMSATNLDDIVGLILDNLVNSNKITYDKRSCVEMAITRPKIHQYREPKVFERSPNFKKASDATKSAFGLLHAVSDMGKMGEGVLSKLENLQLTTFQ